MINMEILNVIEVASVKLMDIEISEDELDVYENCLNYILQTCSPREIENICRATKDELEGMQENLISLLRKYTDMRGIFYEAKQSKSHGYQNR